MFTLDQIRQASSKVKSGADFPQLVQNIKHLGVIRYDNYVEDGRTDYFGANDFVIRGEARHPVVAANEESSAARLKQALAIHQQGETDYPTFCKQALEAGVKKWITNTQEMTVTYFDKKGMPLLVESIPLPR